MEFLSEIFVKFWKEVIVAVMLTAILPFIRAYVRRQRANMMNFFKEKEKLKQSLLEEEKKRKEAEEEVERLRSALEQEQKARAEAEQKYQAELQEKDEIRRKAASVYDTLMQEQKAHKELEQKYQAEAEERLNAKNEAQNLKSALEQEQKTREEAEKAKTVHVSTTSKLMELLKEFESLPEPEDIPDDVRNNIPGYILDLLPFNGDVLRTKAAYAIGNYFSGEIPCLEYHGSQYYHFKYWYYEDAVEISEAKCRVLYALICIAEGVSENQISLDDNKKLTWDTAEGLIDTMYEKYISEDKRKFGGSSRERETARTRARDEFIHFPPELLIWDEAFINGLLSKAKLSLSD